METLIATAFALLFAGCWWMEIRTATKARNCHLDQLFRVREEHARELSRERSESWKAGVRAGTEAVRPKRDKAGRFA